MAFDFMKGFRKKAEHQQTSQLDVYKEKLMGIVYDEDLVNELAPIFAKLHGQEGFDKVWEVIEGKETQLEALAGGDWNKEPDEDDEDEESIVPNKKPKEESPTFKSAEEMLAEKYATK